MPAGKRSWSRVVLLFAVHVVTPVIELALPVVIAGLVAWLAGPGHSH